MRCPLSRCRVGILAAIFWAMPLSAAEPGDEFFEKKIRPILAERCFECHAGKKQKGGLLLDSRAGVRKGGDTGPVIVPGKPNESLLIEAIRYTKSDLKMPPKGKLSASEIADLEQWVKIGAPDPRTGTGTVQTKSPNVDEGRKFWAYQVPRLPALPSVKNSAWPRSRIDRFVLARMESAKLAPGPDASRAALIRRVYFDLIGLPPTPEEIDSFVSDPAADAFEQVVDRLLASPHFGERWGRHWLDVARYADSSGGGRSLLFKDSWRYRDYVIDAFNSDRPYDRFLTEQIAGDLLPSQSPGERERNLIATGFLVLGPTNYERQDKDILETDVIDEQLDTLGRTTMGMTIGCARCHDHKFDPIPTKDYYALAGIFKSTQTLIHDNVSRWVETTLPLPAADEAVYRRHDLAVASLKEKIKLAKQAEQKAVKVVPGKSIVPLKDLPGIVLDDVQGKRVGNWTPSKFSGSYIGDGYLHDGNADKGEKTLTYVPEFEKAGRYEVRFAYTPGSNRATKVPITILHADGEQTFFVNQQESPPIDGHWVSVGMFRFEKGNQGFIIISNEGTTGHVIVDAVQFLPEGEKSVAKSEVKPAPPTGPSSVKQLEAELKRLQDTGPVRPAAMTVKDASKVGDFFVCIRGNIHNKGETVPRGFLQVATNSPTRPIAPKSSGRVELAEWLTRADHPLTARVMVNRIWHYLFGTGLVRTVDVFGTTGELPSHPELLDDLAVRFMHQGWSMKAMIREIVCSRTYQLGSGAPPASDPENRLLSRQNRRRLDAEALRDTMLMVSGRLDRHLGGASIRPGTSTEVAYVFDDGRRSVYTPVFRNRLHELFEAFDFADPNLVGGRRTVSTVSTQALFLLNNPFPASLAGQAATRALTRPATDEQRIDAAWRTALGRLPSAKERQTVLEFLREAGDTPAARHGAWQQVYQMIFACLDFRYVD